MIVDGRPRDLGDRAYLLSPQDLAAYELIDPLIDAGVISFKIEGRLKGGPYVAATCQTYRKAIDAKLADTPFRPSRREELDLAQTFSRGLTPGFLEGVNHQKLVRGRFPKSRGVRLGTVIGVTRRGVRVELAEQVEDIIKAGDGVVFDLGRPEEQEPGGRVWDVQKAQGRPSLGFPVVELSFEPGSLDPSAIPIGCDVYKTDDPALRKRLEQSYSQDKPARRVALTARLAGSAGGPLTLTLTDECGHSSSATWPGPLELARRRATTADEVRDPLARLGDTPFELGELTVELPDPVMVPKSVLNDLRRQAAGELTERRTVFRHPIADPDAITNLRTKVASGGASAPRVFAATGADRIGA